MLRTAAAPIATAIVAANEATSAIASRRSSRSRNDTARGIRLSKRRSGHDGTVTRRRAYFALMGTCVGLITLSWTVVRLFSITAAIVMSVVAMVIPPFAAIIGNLGQPEDRE
ncbi:MAG TPA: DUF3099 domain-containing protein [Mycobacteriales bacterium]|nr:DUF3099 domain-containing protein [Mycobacteriales bacterium]